MSLPLKVMHDTVGMEVSLEVANGEVYNGTVVEVQDTMNVLLKEAFKTSKSGHRTKMESVMIRGSNIVFFQLPDALKMMPALITANKVIPKALDARGAGNGFAARARARRRKD